MFSNVSCRENEKHNVSLVILFYFKSVSLSDIAEKEGQGEITFGAFAIMQKAIVISDCLSARLSAWNN
jgi:hypothetical protein